MLLERFFDNQRNGNRAPRGQEIFGGLSEGFARAQSAKDIHEMGD